MSTEPAAGPTPISIEVPGFWPYVLVLACDAVRPREVELVDRITGHIVVVVG